MIELPTLAVIETLKTVPTWVYLFPLAAIISLVYNASRYELPEKILKRSVRHFGTILGFMGIVFAFLYVLSYRL